MAFPASVSSLGRPTPTTKTNDGGGLNLSTILDAISDDLEAVETKVGISDTDAAQDSPLENTVLASDDDGESKWRKVTTADIAADALTLGGSSAGSSASPAANSTSYATLQGDGPSSELRVDLVLTAAGDIEATLICPAQETSGSTNAFSIALSLNGAAEVNEMAGVTAATNTPVNLITQKVWYDQPAGSYTIRGRYKVAAGANWITPGTRRYLNARAFYR